MLHPRSRKPLFEQLDPRLCMAFGDIDLNFNSSGRFEDSFAVVNLIDSVMHQVESPDRSQLFIESIRTGSGHAVGFTKLDQDGQVVQEFGSNGSLEWFDRDFAESLAYGFRIANGNTIVQTFSSNNSSLTAFDDAGRLDASFADQGLLRLGDRRSGWTSIPHPDGGFLLHHDENLESVLTRYTNHGTLDSNFGRDGVVRLPLIVQTQLSVDPAGKILLFGSRLQNNLSTSVIVRLLADGTPDRTFGVSGTRAVAAPYLQRMHMSPGGDSYFTVVPSDNADYRTYNIEKYTNGMESDTSFGAEGGVQLQVPRGHSALNLFVRPTLDGGLFFEQTWQELRGSRIVIGRVDSQGNWDPSFGNGGIAELTLDKTLFTNGLQQDTAGNLYWIGQQDSDGLIIRFTPTGQLDTRWANAGMRTADRTVGAQTIHSIELAPSYRGTPLIAAGWSREPVPLWGTGRLHVSDREGIRLTTNLGDASTWQPLVVGARDGGWYTIVGTGSNPYFVNVRRFQVNGDLDGSFGNQGLVSVQVPYPHDLVARLDDTGAATIVASDHSTLSDPTQGVGVAVIIRLTPSGQLDRSFGNQGVLRLFEKPQAIRDVMVSPALGIVLAYRNYLQAFNFAGQPLTQFGSAGVATPVNYSTWVTGEIDESGNIFGVINDHPGYRLVKITAQGKLDLAFGNEGQLPLPWDLNVAYSSPELAVQSGIILLANAHGRFNSTVRLLAYDYSGSPLDAFAGTGIRDYDFAPNGEQVTGLEFADDGSVWISLTERRGFNLVGTIYRMLGANRGRMHNWYAPTDVNRDGRVTPLDALLVINHLNAASWNQSFRPDVNNDNTVTPLDILRIINHLNRQSRGEGEGTSELFITEQPAGLNWLFDDDELSYGPFQRVSANDE